jgi:HlyD family secretion protein
MKNFPEPLSYHPAEFILKIIQTKEERVNLVYAVKITVKNDGDLK